MAQRIRREPAKARGLDAITRPLASGRGLIQREEKRSPVSQPLVQEQPVQPTGVAVQPAAVQEELEKLKWAAWSALLVSLVALLMFGIYSARKFQPEFEFQKFQATQQQMATDVSVLKLSTRLANVKNTLINAHLQLFLHKDSLAAKSLLTNAKQELATLIPLFPPEKQAELTQIYQNIERTIQEIREPSQLDTLFKTMLMDLDKM